jgi:hypothetical protein
MVDSLSSVVASACRWAGLTYEKKDNTPYYQEQWDAKDAFWDNAKCRQDYKNNMLKIFNR